MNTLIYAAVAVISVALPLRAWLQDRGDRLRAGFALMGLVLAWTYAAFAVFLATGLAAFDLAYGVGAAFLPVSLYAFLSRLLRRRTSHDPRLLPALAYASLAVATGFVLAQLTLFRGDPHASPAAIALGLWVFSGLGFNLFLVAEHLRRTEQRVTRARLTYLLGLLGGAVVISAVEVLVRNIGGVPEPAALDLFSAPVLLHGALPPVAVLLSGVLVYFMHQVLVLYRLLDLHEIFSRTLTLGICAGLLVLFEGLAVIWNDTVTHSPVHGTWLMLVATVMFLAIYDPLRRGVERRLGAAFNRRGALLLRSLREVDQALPKAIGLATAFDAMLQPLASSGRVPYAAIYLWDQERGQFVLEAARGECSSEPLEAVPPVDLSAPRGAVHPWLERLALVRAARRGHGEAEQAGQRARLLEAMTLDVLLPLTSGDLVLGWLGLADEPWSEGFSLEELGQLRHSANQLAVVLENVHGFHQLEEQHRLAALGTMAAGLAHEIRNPLAAIKGAAQYLGEPAEAPVDDESQEFVGIIVEEVDRLEGVVSRFLDYARPLEICPEPVDINRVVTAAARALERQGVPDDIEIVHALTTPLPEVPGDATLLLQVVENLLRNAVQALEEQRDPKNPKHIRLHTRFGHAFGHGSGPSTVDLVIEDSGPGVPQQDRDKLFIPFYTRKAGGTGLGLALCRRIVHAHGGEIDLGTRPGGGARFTVLLPLESPERPPRLPGS